MTRPLRVGLTGGLASGKSTVAKLLAAAGFKVIDADELVSSLYDVGKPGARAVANILGDDYLTDTGAVDKPKVARLVFADDAARNRLEAAIHPLVRASFIDLAEASGVPIVFEATRLVEAGYAPDFDLVVTVEAPEELRRSRAVARGLGEAEARARLLAQGDGAARRAVADRVIQNDGSLADLEAATGALLDELRPLRTQQ